MGGQGQFQSKKPTATSTPVPQSALSPRPFTDPFYLQPKPSSESAATTAAEQAYLDRLLQRRANQAASPEADGSPNSPSLPLQRQPKDAEDASSAKGWGYEQWRSVDTLGKLSRMLPGTPPPAYAKTIQAKPLQRQEKPEEEQSEETLQAKPLSSLVQREPLPEEEQEVIQPKLTVGAPGDQYEQEADQVAAQVMSMGDRPQPVQREAAPEEKEEDVQAKPIAATITPLVQREEMSDEEEGLQARAIPSLQREEIPEEAEVVQEKAIPAIAETSANASIQREEMPDEGEIQTKSLDNTLQREEMPEEEEIQPKPLVQKSPNGSLQAGRAIESGLSQSKGGGSPLAEDTRSFMESRFNADFSHVRVHTDSSAVQMNKDLSAQAFTHGSDVYFGAGKSPGQNDLTAHELTHVVQQRGAKTLQRKPAITLKSQKDRFQTKINAAEGAVVQLKSAPKSPQSDPGFQAVVKRTEAVAKQQKAHPPAKAKATEAQAAAVPPSNEKESKAQDRQVQEMNQQQPGKFDAAKFKAALMQKIGAAAPSTLEEADKFKDGKQLEGVKQDAASQVGNEKKQAAGAIEDKAKEAPKPGGIPDKSVTPLPPPPQGTPPGDIGAAQAVPKPKDASEVSMAESSKLLDQQMTDANVTEEQINKSNEPEFKGALGAKKEAQANAVTAPAEYRQQEQTTIAQAQTQAQATVQAPLQGMQGQKGQALAQVSGLQTGTKGQDEQKRAEVSNYIQGVYNATKQEVEKLLTALDKEVTQEFDRGANAAKQAFDGYVNQRMQRFKDERYPNNPAGWAQWVIDRFSPPSAEVNGFYAEGRKLYLQSMDSALDRVANLVSTKLNAAKTEIANGRQNIQKHVAGLDPSLRQVGQDAAQAINQKFDALEQNVDNKQNELLDSLAQKYNEKLEALDAEIEKKKEENKGLVDKAKDAIGETVKTILELKNMLMGMLAKAAGAVEKIIKDPIGFLGNLVAGIKQGFMGFVGNITTHLKKGLIGWLTGSLSGAGIEMPKSFDLKGIFALVTGILGLTYQGMRDRVANKVGEKKVSALEKGFDMFILWKNEGAAGLWKFIQDKLGNLQEMVMGGIQSFVIDTIINAGVTWVLSLLNPASAFVRACKLIIDVIMFFVERGSQIAELVNAVLDSVGAIADGAIGIAAKLVEGALAKALPVVIGFLASLIGLGGISGKIQDLIKKVRGLVDKAIDWVLGKALAFVKKLGGKLGFGRNSRGNQNAPSNRNEQENKHAVMGVTAAKELSKQSSTKLPYEDLRQQKQNQAKQLEGNYNRQLENPVRMRITFKPSAEDKKDGKLDFHVHIGPNDFDTDAAVENSITDEGSQSNPFELSWPKPAASAYPVIYLGGPINKPKSQAELKQTLGQKDETNYEVKAYSPTAGGTLPDGEKIGIASQYQVAVGKVIGPLSRASTSGGRKINKILKKYGFIASAEGLDGDHVQDIQFGGPNTVENLWPLQAGINQKAGPILAQTSVKYRDTNRSVRISELKDDTSRQYYFKINKTL